jgi:hypothetical protein
LKIVLVIIAITLAVSINNAYGSAACPENTKWDGNNCVHIDTGKPITFTDYGGNPINAKKNNDDKPRQNIIITKPVYEILNELIIIKPEIKEVEDMRGKALEQKIIRDAKIPTNLTRENYYFGENIKYSIKNAEFVFYTTYGKEIQNPDFGKNNEHQIDYDKRYNRSEDPILQNAMINEKKRAVETFIKTWGNFTNH